MATETKAHPRWLGKVDEIYRSHAKEVEASLTGSVVSVAKTVNVSGFNVEVPDEPATKALREKISREAANEKLLRSKLNVAGITPIAILPEDVFNKIIAKAGFYTFYRMMGGNMVYGNGDSANNYVNRSDHGVRLWEALLVTALCAVLGAVAFSELANIFHYDAGLKSAARITTGFITLVVLALASLGAKNTRKVFFCALAMGLACYAGPFAIVFAAPFMFYFEKIRTKHMWKKGIRQALWPKKNDTDSTTWDKFQIVLPEAPDHVKKVLAKCHLGNIITFTTVHPNAFSVVFNEVQAARLWAKYDPVICTRENGMVAVLEQFGDFPEEKEVVQYIKKHFDDFRTGLLRVDSLN